MRCLLTACLVALLMVGCDDADRERVDSSARIFDDPDGLPVKPGPEPFIRSIHLANRTLVGVIQLTNGKEVRFWQLPRANSKGIGLTRFDFPDGTSRYMRAAAFGPTCALAASRQTSRTYSR
ncbi:MAG: hypothetical protein H6718_28375 [Polyangiaceae bacterium]|nr:hypothetical protein [Myxococcales bacterium]MCB9589365.1 hypothetical protein [Polyangiaceae bacterium]